jgi:methylase of polypeptide subunit release factors
MGLHPDHVIGAGGASVTLAAITPRNRVARTFDLGTGCGIQAVLAAGHSSHVVASDRSERALGMAGRTAALSGVSLDLRHGSLFEPVAGETFDLIVANPPFVISPHAHYSYRESPLRADDLSRTVMQQSVGHLAPGGTAVILANWLHTNEQHWRERLASWAPSGCAVWVAQREFLTPPQYVEVWLRDSAELGAPGYEARYAEWLTYLEDIGATGVGFGWIVLHRDGQEWFVAEDLSDAERLPNGQEVTAQLQDFDALHRATAIQLLNSSPRWRDDVELHNSWSPTAGPGTTKLVATGAWRPPEQLDNGVAELLSRDGTLSERIEAQSGHDLEAIDNLTARALVCLRRLIGSGLVSIEG